MIEEPGHNRKKRRKKGKTKKEWEKLREVPIIGISTMADGSLVSAPISGKALPRLGRAIRSSMTSGIITGDQNPLTRVDGNENGLIFDGTWREMPDPTPGNRGGVSGRIGRRDNPTKFVGLDTLLAKHFAQSEQFDEWEKNNDWNAFHRNHFDWWMFPIPRGSNSYGDGYNIAGEPLETLKADKRYMQSLAKSVRQYFRAMAWDIDKNDWVKDADFNNGQNPIRNINSARLYKIAQSTYAHGMMDEHRSIRRMANSLINSNVRVGNEDYWTSPIGVSGRMALGRNINPTKFEPVGENSDPFSDNWKRVWDSRDDMSPGYPDKLWDWKNEEERREYGQKILGKKVKKGYLVWGLGDGPGKTSKVLGELSGELLPILQRDFGILHQRVGTYPAFQEPYGKILTHSASPYGQSADANIVRDILGKYHETLNPSEFYTRFEAWIRNPFVTIRDPKSGKDVGVRKHFNNDRQLMLAEFRSRVKNLFDSAYMREHGQTYDQWRGPEKDAVELSPKEILSALKTTHPDVIDKSKALIPRILNANPRSMHRFHSIFSDELSLRASQEDIKLVTPGVLREIIKENTPSFDDDMVKKFPDFFEPDALADLNDSEIELARIISDSLIEELIEFDEEDIKIPQASVAAFAETMRGEFGNFTDSHARSILTDSVLRLNPQGPRRGVSGKMSLPDSIEAEYIGYDSDDPTHIANHMLSRESSYDVRPEPVDDIKTAIETGAPLKWLMPGSYHPQVEEFLNNITEHVISNGYDSIEDVRETGTGDRDTIDDFKAKTGEWVGELQLILARLVFYSKDRDLNDGEIGIIEAITGSRITRYSEIEDLVNSSEDPRAKMLDSLISKEEHPGQTNMVAAALVARASHAGFKTNFLASQSQQGRSATDDTLDFWQRSIYSSMHNNSFEGYEDRGYKPEIAVSMPVEALLKMLTGNGEYKTVFDEGATSRGNNNENVRFMQEFTMFGYLPGYRGKRPVYGVVAPGGLTPESLEYTHNYGSMKIVLKPEVRDRSTWTESDSLSIVSTASSFSNPSKHGLVAENLKGDLEQFAKQDLYIEDGEPIPTVYTEAQIHGGVTVDDIAYIVVDDRFYNSDWYGRMNWPQIDAEGNPTEELPDSLDEYGPFIQISKIAESLQIPVIRANAVIEAGEEVVRP